MPSANSPCEVLRERVLDVARRLVSECGRDVTLHEVAQHAQGQDTRSGAIVESLLEQRLGDLVDVVRLADRRPALRTSGWTQAVREIVSGELDLSLREVARALAVSVRTLQRRLADEGTNWRAEIDAARKERAAQLLQQGTTADLTAAQVGYSGSRALRRAQRRWDRESG
jgi:AraC-like DNA-binding protein